MHVLGNFLSPIEYICHSLCEMKGSTPLGFCKYAGIFNITSVSYTQPVRYDLLPGKTDWNGMVMQLGDSLH